MEEYILNATETAFNDTFNFDNFTNDSFDENIEHFCISLLLICCLLAMCVNCVVIVSVYWIRSPMTPNLKISLSLAIADAVSSSMTGLLLFLDEIRISPKQLGVFPCLIELLRLSGIVITVLHLLALSLNHYIGIMKPLHYNSIVTKRKVSTVIALLWICPVILLVILCTIESKALFENVLHNTSEARIFTTFLARMSYGTLFFCPIVLMVFCYAHILITVRNQQNKWKNLSRLGSTRNKGRNVNGRSSSQKANREQVRLQGNIKAINTTLLILGSCFIGWMPALLILILMCSTDCPISGETLITLNLDYKYEVMTLRLIENMLVIMKMLANPIIYTIRMKEIKDSTHRMYLALAGLFCPSRRNNNAYSIAYQSSRKQNSVVTSQVRLNSFHNNLSDSHVI